MKLGECMKTYAEVDRQVIPIIGKCLDGIVTAAEAIDQKSVSGGSGLSATSSPCRVGCRGRRHVCAPLCVREGGKNRETDPGSPVDLAMKSRLASNLRRSSCFSLLVLCPPPPG